MLAACFLFVALAGDDKPRALREMEKSRLRITRADVHWSQVSPLEESYSRGQPIFYRSLIGERETAIFNDGTPDGVGAWNEDGTPVPGSRRSHLVRDHDRWELETDKLKGLAWEEEPPPDQVVDVRTFGLLPIPKTMTTVERAIDDLRPDEVASRRFRQREENGVHVVEMEMTRCGHSVVWHIDPKLDWNPVRSELYVRGARVLECDVEYQRCGDVWFPSSASYYNSAGDLVNQITVHEARINTPDLPRHLTPESIGYGEGMFVAVQAGPRGARSARYVTGGRLVDPGEYDRLEGEGKVKNDPRLVQRWAELERRAADARPAQATPRPKSGDGAAAADTPAARHTSDDEWEKHTLAFIARYALDVAQAQAALHVLRDCQERRTAVIRPRRQRVDELERRLLTASSDDDRRAAAAALERERDDISRKVQEIFERQLKPRLEQIPSRAQRQAVDGVAPAGRP